MKPGLKVYANTLWLILAGNEYNVQTMLMVFYKF